MTANKDPKVLFNVEQSGKKSKSIKVDGYVKWEKDTACQKSVKIDSSILKISPATKNETKEVSVKFSHEGTDDEYEQNVIVNYVLKE